MPIARENGFHVSHDLAHVSCLGIESERLEECVAAAKTHQIKGVFGSPSYGFAGQDLDFLSELPWVEAVWFWDVKLNDIEGLYSLADLRHFGVFPKRPAIDFSRFSKLQKAVWQPKTRDCGLGALPCLELLHVWHYQPKQEDFTSLELPPSLGELQINWTNASSLESLPMLPELQRLEIHRCRNLKSLGDLGSKFPRLEHFVVDACRRVSPREGQRVIKQLPNLSHAYVQGVKLV